LIDTLIENTKKVPNYRNIVRVIKIIRVLFNKDQDKAENEKKKKEKEKEMP
jgi:hypothetical protein